MKKKSFKRLGDCVKEESLIKYLNNSYIFSNTFDIANALSQ